MSGFLNNSVMVYLTKLKFGMLYHMNNTFWNTVFQISGGLLLNNLNRCRTLPKIKWDHQILFAQIQQRWSMFLQVCDTHFKHWFAAIFSRLTVRQNKSRPAGEIFRICTWRNDIFFPVKRENNGKTIFISTTALKTSKSFAIFPC